MSRSKWLLAAAGRWAVAPWLFLALDQIHKSDHAEVVWMAAIPRWGRGWRRSWAKGEHDRLMASDEEQLVADGPAGHPYQRIGEPDAVGIHSHANYGERRR